MAPSPTQTSSSVDKAPKMAWGSVIKDAEGEVTVEFGVEFAATPTVVLTSCWTSAVHHVETLISITTTNFRFSSKNCAADYRVNWIAIGQ